MNKYFSPDEKFNGLSEMELDEADDVLLEQIRDRVDSLQEMPAEIKFFFDRRYNSILSEVPAGMVKRVLILETMQAIKRDPECDGLSVFIENYYKIMRAYNRKGAREFLEMISIQTNEEEETIDDSIT